MQNNVRVCKDKDQERSVPTVWRPIFVDIIDAFMKKNYLLSEGVKSVSVVSNETAKHIKEYIADYGEELTQLPEETWESSVCIWMGTHWDVLIDLWTKGEGASDLVLSAKVSESDRGYIVDIGMVYVP